MSSRRQDRLDDAARRPAPPARSAGGLLLLALGALGAVVLVLYGLTFVFME